MGDVLRPPRHRPARGPDRGRSTTKASSAAAARRSSAPTTRPRSRSSWSWSPGTPHEPPPVGIELVLTVAEEQGLRGAKAFDASALRSESGFVLDHAGAGRRGDRRHPDPAEDPRRLHRGRGARRDPARGRQQRDRRRRRGDLADGAGAARRGDDRQRRPDRGRHLGQRRPRPLPDPGRGAQPRRRPGRRGRRADLRRLRLGRERARLRRRRAGRRAVPRLRGARRPRRRCGCAEAGLRRRRPGAGADGDRRRQRRQRAAASTASTAVLLANGTDAIHTADESVSAASLEKMLEVCEGILARRGRRGDGAGTGEA